MALQASVGLQGFEVVLFRAVAFCSVLFDMVGPVLGPRGNENLIYLAVFGRASGRGVSGSTLSGFGLPGLQLVSCNRVSVFRILLYI